MLQAFALDPCVPANDSTAFAVFVHGLGVEHGRLLAEFTKRWRALAVERIRRQSADASSRDTKRAEALLTRLATDGSIRVRLGLSFDPECTWLENATLHHEAFAAVITADGAEPEAASWAHGSSTLIEGATFWQVPRYGRFKSTPANLAGCLGPLLALDTAVAFMDPFFDAARDQYIKSLQAILNAAPNLTRLVLHSAAKVGRNGTPVPVDVWRENSRDRLLPLVRPELTITLVRWRELDRHDEPHERWVATPRGAATLDRGIAADGKTNAYNLLPSGEATSRWQSFGLTPYSVSSLAHDGEVSLGKAV